MEHVVTYKYMYIYISAAVSTAMLQFYYDIIYLE